MQLKDTLPIKFNQSGSSNCFARKQSQSAASISEVAMPLHTGLWSTFQLRSYPAPCSHRFGCWTFAELSCFFFILLGNNCTNRWRIQRASVVSPNLICGTKAGGLSFIAFRHIDLRLMRVAEWCVLQFVLFGFARWASLDRYAVWISMLIIAMMFRVLCALIATW